METITATAEHIDRARAAGYTMDREHVAAWLYEHFDDKTWKNGYTRSDPWRSERKIGEMRLALDTYDRERREWVNRDTPYIQTEWFEERWNDDAPRPEDALYAAAVLWIAEHEPDHPAHADARRDLGVV